MSHMSCREKILPGNAIFGCNWQHGCCLRFRCHYSIFLFLNSLFCKTTACARLNRGRFTMCLSALNTYEVRPGNKNLFFFDLSASAATPNCSAAAVLCKLYCIKSNLLLAKCRALDKQLWLSGCSCSNL